jgi:phage-related protein
MPFAGMINAPANMSKMKYAEKNFAECTQNILTDITDIALIPVHYIVSIITAIVGEIMKIVNDMREIVDKIRNSFTDITSDIMSRILNIMTPLIETIITTKSMLGKSNGVVTAVMYTLFGVYLSIKSLIGSILEIVIILLIAMAAAIVLLFFIPIVGDILAAAGIIFFIAVAIPMGHLIGFSNNILNVHASRGVPSVPHG